MITRRYFLRSSGIVIAGIGIAPSWLLRATTLTSQTRNKREVLVAIFQRGAADGLNIVAPYFEKRYYDMRPTIASAAAGQRKRRHRSGWPLCAASIAPAAEAAVGPPATGNYSRSGFTGPDAFPFRCPGLHGIGDTGEDSRGEMLGLIGS